MRNLVTIFCFVLLSLNSYSQSPTWVNTIGSNGTDDAYSTDVDAAGNIYVSGRFSGTVDFDPGPGTFNMTSNGLTDAYVAKYNKNGQFIWAFSIGSTSYDGAQKVKINSVGEVLVTGYFRYNVDFDPGAGTFLLNGPGQAGTDVGFGGDIFVAKYTSAGAFVWAFKIEGEFSQDKTESMDLDDNDNIYIAGAVNCTSSYPIDADPGPAVYDIGGPGHGHGFVAKYTTNSNFIWAFNLGGYGLNSGVHKIKVVPGDTTFVIAGFYRGTNIDFDPGPGTFLLSSNGVEDMMVAKYSLNKNFIWAYGTGGTSLDVGLGLDIDQNQDVYVSGWFSGTNVDFNPSTTVASNLSSNGGYDAYVVKYSKNGDYLWAKSFGGTLDDISWTASLNGSEIYLSGEFRNTADFDPGAATFNMTSSGGSDIFISRFDTTGNFLCAEKMGGAQDERGYMIQRIAPDSFLFSGNYGTNNIDFDPSTTVSLIKTNAGQGDAFVGKYFTNTVVSNMTPTLKGDTVCQGTTPQLIINFGTGVTGSYSVVINNGTSNQTYNGITSGVPFSPTPVPTTTTTYTLVSVATLAAGCSSINIPVGISATVTVHATPPVTGNASPATVCPGSPTILTGNGAATYTWSSGATNGVSFIPGATSTYTVTGTDAFGCTSSSTVTVSVVNNLNINILPSVPVICIGDSVHLNASGANSYSWSPNTSISSVNIPDPIVFPTSATTYTVIGTDATGCTGTASVLIDVVTNPKLIVSKSGDVECNIRTIQLSASGTSTSYVWSPATFLSSPNSGITNATLTQTTTFVVTGTVGSCVLTDSITVDVYNNDETAIYIPNAFSPNGDGMNDCLRVLNTAHFSSYYFAIYNRWGQRVFEADSPDKCWDGTFNNQPVLLDVYYYFMKAETRCGKVFKKGDITVIR